MIDPAPVIDLGRLAPVFDDLGLGRPIELTSLDGGSAATFRVNRHGDDPVILKIYNDVSQAESGKETYASGLLAGTGIPITQFLAFDDSRARLPYRFAVTNYLPGVSVGALRHEPDIADLHEQMGALLRRLHEVRLPAYGRFDAEGIVEPIASHPDFMLGLWARVLDRFLYNGADQVLAERLDRIVTGGADIFALSSGPVFAHDDFQPNNVLGQRDESRRLALTGLIDFGNARAADATFDLAKALFCSEHEAPGSSRAILKGYGQVDHPDPEAALWLYTLIHRVVMWYWLRQIGVIPQGVKHALIVDLEAMASQKQL